MRVFSVFKLSLLSIALVVSVNSRAEEAKVFAPSEPVSQEPTALSQCKEAKTSLDELIKLSREQQLPAALKLLVSLPETTKTNSAELFSEIEKDISVFWAKYMATESSCPNVRLKLVRLLGKASKDPNVSMDEKKQNQDAILQAVSKPHFPFVLESMINLGVLDEVVSKGVFSSADASLVKKIAARTKKAKSEVAKGSRAFEQALKGTALWESAASDIAGKFEEFFKNPKNQKVVAQYKKALISEIKLADEIQKDVTAFSKQLGSK